VAISKALGWTPVEPEGTMYGMFRHTGVSDMDEVIRALEAGIGVSPGNIFFAGQPANTGYIRIHCGVTREKALAIAERLQQPQS
jgi:aspartate/methionine/tyrosine aminotransferase